MRRIFQTIAGLTLDNEDDESKIYRRERNDWERGNGTPQDFQSAAAHHVNEIHIGKELAAQLGYPSRVKVTVEALADDQENLHLPSDFAEKITGLGSIEPRKAIEGHIRDVGPVMIHTGIAMGEIRGNLATGQRAAADRAITTAGDWSLHNEYFEKHFPEGFKKPMDFEGWLTQAEEHAMERTRNAQHAEDRHDYETVLRTLGSVRRNYERRRTVKRTWSAGDWARATAITLAMMIAFEAIARWAN